MSIALPAPDAPLAPEYFVGRAGIVDDIVQRLRQSEPNSTQVAGGPQAGKTSLLRLLASSYVVPQLGNAAASLLRVYVDVSALGTSGTEAMFWERALREIANVAKSDPSTPEGVDSAVAHARQLQKAGKLNIVRLEDFFDDCANAGRAVVLMLDEFDVLLGNANFVPPSDFFDQMRSLCLRRPRGLALVMGTTRPLSDSAPVVGPSPFYNAFGFVRLGPLDDADMAALCSARAKTAGVPWPAEMAGRIAQASFAHPYLAGHLLDKVLRRGEPVRLGDDEVFALMQDPAGPYKRLAVQIEARLKPGERNTVQAALGGGKLSDQQRDELQRLRLSSLLPPGFA